MQTFKQGDLIRVPFPYTDRSAYQHRPALVVSAGGIGELGALLWVAMITSAGNRPWPGDISLTDEFEATGLPVPSIIRPCKIATIDARLAARLGRISPDTMSAVRTALQQYLDVWPSSSSRPAFHE